MYKSKHNFSFEERKYFKGEYYDEIPRGYEHWFSKEERVVKEVAGKAVETASLKPKTKRKKK